VGETKLPTVADRFYLMDIFELSDFEFEELEDFGERNKPKQVCAVVALFSTAGWPFRFTDEWSKYEVIQCDSVEKVDRAQPR